MARVAKVKMSVEELLSALKKHQARLPKLQRQESKLLKQLARVQEEISLLGGGIAPIKKAVRAGRKVNLGRPVASRKRAKNALKLADAIVAVLNQDTALSVPQIAKAVQANGYTSKSKTFQTIIYQTLARDKRVKRVSRGQYQLKG